ncbi:MAG: hypothetical protein M3N23_01995, partial [Pseudomonadota bacterium]|nr:hypothetical protein [Pseudomonadota bacterium]
EQSAGIGEVNQAIAQMDEMTQQNAALVEQAAAAAQSMQDQAASLSQTVSVFTLEPGSQWASSAEARPRQQVALVAPANPRIRPNAAAARGLAAAEHAIAPKVAAVATTGPARATVASIGAATTRVTAPSRKGNAAPAGSDTDWEEF